MDIKFYYLVMEIRDENLNINYPRVLSAERPKAGDGSCRNSNSALAIFSLKNVNARKVTRKQFFWGFCLFCFCFVFLLRKTFNC